MTQKYFVYDSPKTQLTKLKSYAIIINLYAKNAYVVRDFCKAARCFIFLIII